MNLHAILFASSDMPLILDYVNAYYGFASSRIGADGQSIDYRFTFEGNGWNNINARDTLTYTNRALEWHRAGRPPIRA